MSESVQTFDGAKLNAILSRFVGKPGALIPILQQTQDEYGYLPREAVRRIARGLRMPEAQVYGVATFYAQFHLKPRGRHIIRVCLGTACHVRGAEMIFSRITSALDLNGGGTTEDLAFTVEKVACLGCCGLAPMMMIDDETYGRLTPKSAMEIVNGYLGETLARAS